MNTTGRLFKMGERDAPSLAVCEDCLTKRSNHTKYCFNKRLERYLGKVFNVMTKRTCFVSVSNNHSFES